MTSESRSQQEGRQNAACDLATSVVEPLLIETLHRECTQEVPGTNTDKSQQYEPISNLVSVSVDGWEPSSPGVQAHACVQGGEREDLTLSSENYSVTKSCRHHSEAGFDKTIAQREVSPGILMPQKPLINIPERNRGDTFWDGCKNGQRGWPECPVEEFPKEEEVFLEKFSRTKIDLHPNPSVHTVFDNPQHSSNLSSCYSPKSAQPDRNSHQHIVNLFNRYTCVHLIVYISKFNPLNSYSMHQCSHKMEQET